MVIGRTLGILLQILVGSATATWLATPMWEPVHRERTPAGLLNLYMAVGVLLSALCLSPFDRRGLKFGMGLLLSGAILTVATGLAFVASKHITYSITGVLVMGSGILARAAWDHFYLGANIQSELWFIAAFVLQFLALVLVIRFHGTHFRVGPVTVVLDMFGIEEKSVMLLRGTSVTELKRCLWKNFWEQSIDLGNLDDFELQIPDMTQASDESEEFVTVTHIRQIPKDFGELTVRVAATGDHVPTGKGGGKRPLSNITEYDDGSSGGQNSKAPSDAAYGSLLGAEERSPDKGTKMALHDRRGGVRSDDNGTNAMSTEDWDEHTKTEALEIGRRLSSVDWKAHSRLYRQSRADRRMLLSFNMLACISGMLLVSADIPILKHDQTVSVDDAFSLYPVIGFTALFVAPALPLHNNMASCVSYHLSRQCNTMPTFPHACSVFVLGTVAGFLWVVSTVVVVILSNTETFPNSFFVCFGIGTIFVWAYGTLIFREFEHKARWRLLCLCGISLICGIVMNNYGPSEDIGL